MSDRISLAFARVIDLGLMLGVRNINQLPGCWEVQVDGKWYVALNGRDSETPTSRGVPVPSYHCYVEYNGWPAGLFSPLGGPIAAGSGANEDSFIAAVNKRIAIEDAKYQPKVQP